MHYKIIVFIFIGAIIYLAGAAPANGPVTERLVGILSWNSGQFVVVTSNGGLYASAASQSKQTQYMYTLVECPALWESGSEPATS